MREERQGERERDNVRVKRKKRGELKVTEEFGEEARQIEERGKEISASNGEMKWINVITQAGYSQVCFT